MSTLHIHIPDETLISLKTDPQHFAGEVVLLAAVKLFELGKLSSGRAAELAGLSRVEFLAVLKHYQVAPFQTNAKELHDDVLNA
jgi:predicted HTH domain antitoxin